jgi:uncharacterized protein YecT (DUF1311 family)
MRISLVVLGLLAIAPASIAFAEDCGSAATQTEMNACAAQNNQKADARLNALYRQITGRLKDDSDATKALVAAQRAWISFRDAECAFVGSKTAGGSVNPAIVAQCKTGLTELRVKDFEYFLQCQEGDLSCPVPGP